MSGRRAIYSVRETAMMLGVSEQILMQEFKSGIIEGKITEKGKRKQIKFSKQNIERQRIDYSKKPGGNDSV
jgi:hypothetical protein